ncbi:uncharacterized protein PRCAT00001931001 [Priceomyces carsonii]|uniref:uncharacterized protein n=1 Tax=Priceomyces carsonii TaxID=28549 RepID=UPI002ED900CB|nr:unnamed protein product [Priceomyces carsonii]
MPEGSIKINYEFDGSFLQSLSIDDTTSYYTPQAGIDDQIEENDMMEIDDSFDLKYISERTKFTTPPIDMPDTEKDQSGSFTPITDLSKYMKMPFQSTPLEQSTLSNSSKETLTYQANPKGDEPEKLQENKRDNGDDSDVNENSSLMSAISNSLLSPTNLGAKLATRKPKLYLPAPSWYLPSESEESREQGFDHEYDLSSFGNSTSSQVKEIGDHRDQWRSRFAGARNLSSFSSDADKDAFFVKDRDIDGKSDSYINEQNSSYNPDFNRFMDENALGRSFYYRRQNEALKSFDSSQDENFISRNGVAYSPWMEKSPIQVHHHHYYYQNSPSATNTPNNIRIGFNTSGNISPSQKNGLEYMLDEDSNAYLTLPPPWQKNSAPHERIPYLLSSYLQVLVNLIVSCYAFYLLYTIVSAIRRDINHKLSQHTSSTLVEIASCRRSYMENNCSPDEIVPALEKPCKYWLKCMNQDPHNGGNTSLISAETLGMIVNSLVEPLGLKFFLVLFGFIFLIFTCNFTFGFIRAKSYYGWSREEIKNNVSETNIISQD